MQLRYTPESNCKIYCDLNSNELEKYIPKYITKICYKYLYKYRLITEVAVHG